MKDKKDIELVELAQNGSDAAFNELNTRYWNKMIHLAMKFAKNQEDAEDIVQGSFLKAYVNINRFKGNSAFNTWLFRIVSNESKNYIQSRSKKVPQQKVEMSDIEDHFVDSSSPYEEMSSEQLNVMIDETIENLPDEIKLPFMLCHFEGMNYKDIADVTGVPVGTIRSRIFRARKEIDPEIEIWRKNDSDLCSKN